ncbi:hypothetical protein XU18_1343 [Perkinsela sp. CCAP 1560/4]|nr:hypothetical protein XU18_1343 [Perkinsela sp. CCAP 1560/4]|eukprot:KNH08013.1 hypothetical protein XU18_1343 [Perkinsela sp. CCAP 1560/4]
MSSDLEDRFDELLRQEQNLEDEYNKLVRNQITEETAAKEIRLRETAYKLLYEKNQEEQEKLQSARRAMESDRKNMEVARALLGAEEELYRSSYEDYAKFSRENEEENRRMEDEFENVSADLRKQHDALFSRNRSQTLEADQIAGEIRKAEEAEEINQENAVKLTEVSEQIAAEAIRSESLRKASGEVHASLREHLQMTAQAELELNAIRSQYENERRIHREHSALLGDLHGLVERAATVTSDYTASKEQLLQLEKVVREACEGELQRDASC